MFFLPNFLSFNMKILSFGISFAAVSSSVIELDTSPLGFGFAFSYSIVGGNGLRMRAHICTDSNHRGEEYSESMLNITTANNEAMIVPNFIGERSRILGIVSTGFGSRFATELANQWMMIPMHRQLILNPSNPSNFVYGGILGTTRSLSPDAFLVRVSVSILNVTQELLNLDVPSPVEGPSTSFGISPGSRLDYIPSNQMRDLYFELQSRGIESYTTFHRDRSIAEISIGDLSDEIIDTLPTIQYHVHCESGTSVIINLFGRDYVGPRSGRRRLLNLKSFPVDRGVFGQPTLSKIALYIDNRNRTIGFGEPL
jgi:hypothetical protein